MIQNKNGSLSLSISSIAGTARYNYSSGDTIQHNDLSPTQLHYTEPASHSNKNASTSTSATTSQYKSNNHDEEDRRCWICFGEDGDSEGNWVNPCPCSLVAHEKCLLDWITENQKGSPSKTVHCPQCSAEYHLIEKSNLALSFFGAVDEIVHTTAPYISALGFGLSLLVVSTTYGAFSVLLLFGTKEGERVLGSPSNWSWRAWVGLPCIPLTLLSSRSRWADSTLPFAAFLFLRASTTSVTTNNNSSFFSFSLSSSPLSLLTNQTSFSLPQMQFSWPPSPLATLGLLPWVRLFYNNIYNVAQYCISRQLSLKIIDRRQQQQQRRNSISINQVILPNNDTTSRNNNNNNNNNTEPERNPELDILLDRGRPTSLGMVFMGTLMWPVISNVTGSFLGQFSWFQKHFPEPFHRNVLGGCFFVVIKDIGSLIYRYQKVRQYRSRRLLNYNEFKK
ncbi:unnamed protein product [Cunninghamella echinulata]